MSTFIAFIKKSIHKLFQYFGYEFIKLGHFDQGLGSHLVKVFTSRDIDCVLDVGGNTGQYGTYLREIGYTGFIVSFEPVSSAFAALQKKTENDQKWICYNIALGDQAGEREINVFSDTQFSSFLQASDYSKSMWQDIRSSTSEITTIARLDDLFADIREKTSAGRYFLKLDTQGFDLNVFRGARESLKDIYAMQSELSLISVYRGMQNSFAGIEQYRVSGFFISGLFPINIEKGLAVIEYDCVLVKQENHE
jgi:FkbM family methyltransferase